MKTFNLTLDPNQLHQVAEEIRDYAREFESKVKAFFDACAEHGIMVAQMHEGDFYGYIVYSKKFEIEGDDYIIYIRANSHTISRTWFTSSSGNKSKSASINPLLMAEFGSGWNALKDSEIPEGVNAGQGSLNTYGNAFRPNGWSWWTDNASDQTDAQFIKQDKGLYLFKTKGITPTRPLHNAAMSLVRDIEGIASGIFH